MGNNATAESLAVRWTEICADPLLTRLPYKIELNAWGKIEMSPASNRHGRLQALIGAELMRRLPGGIVISESAILTDIGIRVPDVVWGSAAFAARYGETTPYPHAPEICVEIVSRSNTTAEVEEKTRAYLAAGATEVWIVAESGGVRVFAASGELPASGFGVTLTLPEPLSGAS